MTPVNIVTGFLGSGKTTIILKLLEQIENPEEVVWLKNEYGDVNIDKLLLEKTHAKPVEIMNGCLCCVLVGRLNDALEEITSNYAPKRIIIETSGTAWPGPIVREVRRVEGVIVDSVVYVVDTKNFSGFEDISYVADMQRDYVDLVVLNKYPESVAEGSKVELDLEHKLDDVYQVFHGVKKIKTVDGKVSIEEIVGQKDSKKQRLLDELDANLARENKEHEDHVSVEEVFIEPERKFSQIRFEQFISEIAGENVLRIKGVVNLNTNQSAVFSWVGGSWSWDELETYKGETKVVFMFRNEELSSAELEEKLLALAG